MPFMRDLALGSRGEAYIEAILAKHNIPCGLAPTKGYDLEAIVEDSLAKLEVKYDVFSARSGNIAIEYFNPKSCIPSGIASTQANIWVHIITKPMSAWITGVESLRKFIVDTPPHRIIDCGGDKNSSMYLYKIDTIFPAIFKRIDECDTPSLLSIFSHILKGGPRC